MKKLLALLLALISVATLMSACNKKDDKDTAEETEATEATENEESSPSDRTDVFPYGIMPGMTYDEITSLYPDVAPLQEDEFGFICLKSSSDRTMIYDFYSFPDDAVISSDSFSFYFNSDKVLCKAQFFLRSGDGNVFEGLRQYYNKLTGTVSNTKINPTDVLLLGNWWEYNGYDIHIRADGSNSDLYICVTIQESDFSGFPERSARINNTESILQSIHADLPELANGNIEHGDDYIRYTSGNLSLTVYSYTEEETNNVVYYPEKDEFILSLDGGAVTISRKMGGRLMDHPILITSPATEVKQFTYQVNEIDGKYIDMVLKWVFADKLGDMRISNSETLFDTLKTLNRSSVFIDGFKYSYWHDLFPGDTHFSIE